MSKMFSTPQQPSRSRAIPDLNFNTEPRKKKPANKNNSPQSLPQSKKFKDLSSFVTYKNMLESINEEEDDFTPRALIPLVLKNLSYDDTLRNGQYPPNSKENDPISSNLNDDIFSKKFSQKVGCAQRVPKLCKSPSTDEAIKNQATPRSTRRPPLNELQLSLPRRVPITPTPSASAKKLPPPQRVIRTPSSTVVFTPDHRRTPHSFANATPALALNFASPATPSPPLTQRIGTREAKMVPEVSCGKIEIDVKQGRTKVTAMEESPNWSCQDAQEITERHLQSEEDTGDDESNTLNVTFNIPNEFPDLPPPYLTPALPSNDQKENSSLMNAVIQQKSAGKLRSRIPVPKKPKVHRGYLRNDASHVTLDRVYSKDFVSQFSARELTGEAEETLHKCTNEIIDQLMREMIAYLGKKTNISIEDIEEFMKEQKMVTNSKSLRVLIEQHLPLEYREQLIPMAVANNEIIP